MKPLKKSNIAHYISAKGKNKRIEIVLYSFEEGKVFRVMTKTLASFKERKILTADNTYSVETFVVLNDLMSYFLDNSEVKNKILLKELAAAQKFNATTSLKQ